MYNGFIYMRRKHLPAFTCNTHIYLFLSLILPSCCADVWKLDIWDAGLHRAGLHCNIQGMNTNTHTHLRLGCSKASGLQLSFPTAGTGHPLLDLDQPLCHLGLTYFLCGLLTAVGWNHLVRALQVLFLKNMGNC